MSKTKPNKPHMPPPCFVFPCWRAGGPGSGPGAPCSCPSLVPSALRLASDSGQWLPSLPQVFLTAASATLNVRICPYPGGSLNLVVLPGTRTTVRYCSTTVPYGGYGTGRRTLLVRVRGILNRTHMSTVRDAAYIIISLLYSYPYEYSYGIARTSTRTNHTYLCNQVGPGGWWGAHSGICRLLRDTRSWCCGTRRRASRSMRRDVSYARPPGLLCFNARPPHMAPDCSPALLPLIGRDPARR